jgi:hypothetical protein
MKSSAARSATVFNINAGGTRPRDANSGLVGQELEQVRHALFADVRLETLGHE